MRINTYTPTASNNVGLQITWKRGLSVHKSWNVASQYWKARIDRDKIYRSRENAVRAIHLIDRGTRGRGAVEEQSLVIVRELQAY